MTFILTLEGNLHALRRSYETIDDVSTEFGLISTELTSLDQAMHHAYIYLMHGEQYFVPVCKLPTLKMSSLILIT